MSPRTPEKEAPPACMSWPLRVKRISLRPLQSSWQPMTSPSFHGVEFPMLWISPRCLVPLDEIPQPNASSPTPFFSPAALKRSLTSPMHTPPEAEARRISISKYQLPLPGVSSTDRGQTVTDEPERVASKLLACMSSSLPTTRESTPTLSASTAKRCGGGDHVDCSRGGASATASPPTPLVASGCSAAFAPPAAASSAPLAIGRSSVLLWLRSR